MAEDPYSFAVGEKGSSTALSKGYWKAMPVSSWEPLQCVVFQLFATGGDQTRRSATPL